MPEGKANPVPVEFIPIIERYMDGTMDYMQFTAWIDTTIAAGPAATDKGTIWMINFLSKYSAELTAFQRGRWQRERDIEALTFLVPPNGPAA